MLILACEVLLVLIYFVSLTRDPKVLVQHKTFILLANLGKKSD